MSKHFYIINAPERYEDKPEWHIGQRVSAGWYCWDCNVTLCAGGDSEIHGTKPIWLAKCPVCGQRRSNVISAYEALEREHGRVRNLTTGHDTYLPPKTGIRPVSAWYWAMSKEDMEAKIKEVDGLIARLKRFRKGETLRSIRSRNVARDDCNVGYTARELAGQILSCPIQFTHLIGKEFA